METDNIDELGYGETRAAVMRDLRKLAGILLLIPGDSAYIEKEREDTGTEKIIRLEELIRGVLTGKGGHSS